MKYKTEELPKEARALWDTVYNRCKIKKHSEERSNAIAWRAVTNSWFQRDEKWVKKNTEDFTPPDNLPEEAQEIFYDAAYLFSLDNEDKHSHATLAGIKAVSDFGWKETDSKWVFSDKKEFKTHDFDAEIFSVGTWNGDKYTTKDLQEIADNFSALVGEIKPPIKLGHNDSGINKTVSDGQPALGWAEGLFVKGNKLIASFKKVPEVVYEAIKKGLYRRVSSEIYMKYKSKTGKIYGKVLAGVALLGADIPAVKDLADLKAYLCQAPEAGSFDRIAVYSFDVNQEGEIRHDKGGTSSMNEEEIKKMQEDLKKSQDENSTLKHEGNVKDEAIKKLEDDKAEEEKKSFAEKKESLKKEVTEFCDAEVKAGKMTPAASKIVTDSLAAEDKHTYSNESGYGFGFDILKAFMGVQTVLLKKGENGSSQGAHQYNNEGDLQDEMNDKVTKYMADHNYKPEQYGDAVQQVLKEDKVFADRYMANTAGTSDTGGGDE